MVPSAAAGAASGTAVRLGRLFDPDSGNAVVLAFDHGLNVGVDGGGEDGRAVLSRLVTARPDGVLVSLGLLRANADLLAFRGSPAVVVRLDFAVVGDRAAGRGEEHRLLWTVADAAAAGADAVACFLVLGFEDSSRFADNVAAVATVARAAHEHGLPFIVETVPWGAAAAGRPLDVAELRYGCRLAAELGADVVKTEFPGSVELTATVVESTGVPVLVLGGASNGGPAAADLEVALQGGARGAVYGRRVWRAEDPGAVAAELMATAHRKG